MRRTPSVHMGATPNKFQIDLIFHKLELGLSNPTSKISIIIRIGSQKLECPEKYKASKEINLQNAMLSFQTMLYENKSGLHQEKIAQIDICLTNSKLTNSIGIIKLDLSAYANQATSFEKCEYLQMLRSPEYQGKILFTVKGNLIERGASSIEEVNKREYSVIGINKRSLTPTPKSSARRDVLGVQSVNIAQRKLNQMNRTTSKSPFRKEKEEVKMNLTENEQITLEKLMKNLKFEKENKENELKIKTMELSEKDKTLIELRAKLQFLEKENNVLNEENQKVVVELAKNKDFLKQQQQIKVKEKTAAAVCSDLFEKKTDEKVDNDIEIDGRIEETEKNNEEMMLEKLELQIVLQMLKKKKEESNKMIQNLKQNIEQKNQEIDVLNKLNTDLQTEYSKITTKEDTRSPLVAPKEHEEVERKCKNLTEKISIKKQEFEKVQANIDANKKKWEDREKEFNSLQKSFNDVNGENEKIKENILALEKTKKDLREKMEDTNKVLNEAEATYNDAEQKFFKAKRDLADIHNVLMEKHRTDLIEEIEQIRNLKHHI